MPVSIHLLLAAQQQKMGATNKGSVAIGASAFMYTMPIMVEMIFQGVFDRFPKFRLGLIEVGVGWIPHFLEMVDDRYWRNRNWVEFEIDQPPSTYWYSNCAATFMHDHSGIALRHSVGVGNMMWSSDNPHHGNDWPYARKLISEMMADVDPSERHELVSGNAARIYGLDNAAPARGNGAVRIASKTSSRNGALGAAANAKAPSRNGAQRTKAKARVSSNGTRGSAKKKSAKSPASRR
jgi:predicted TIM-barrel fold metal-dependent hydrolase